MGILWCFFFSYSSYFFIFIFIFLFFFSFVSSWEPGSDFEFVKHTKCEREMPGNNDSCSRFCVLSLGPTTLLCPRKPKGRNKKSENSRNGNLSSQSFSLCSLTEVTNGWPRFGGFVKRVCIPRNRLQRQVLRLRRFGPRIPPPELQSHTFSLDWSRS